MSKTWACILNPCTHTYYSYANWITATVSSIIHCHTGVDTRVSGVKCILYHRLSSLAINKTVMRAVGGPLILVHSCTTYDITSERQCSGCSDLRSIGSTNHCHVKVVCCGKKKLIENYHTNSYYSYFSQSCYARIIVILLCYTVLLLISLNSHWIILCYGNSIL